jgi:hypothetical protein
VICGCKQSEDYIWNSPGTLIIYFFSWLIVLVAVAVVLPSYMLKLPIRYTVWRHVGRTMKKWLTSRRGEWVTFLFFPIMMSYFVSITEQTTAKSCTKDVNGKILKVFSESHYTMYVTVRKICIWKIVKYLKNEAGWQFGKLSDAVIFNFFDNEIIKRV